MMEAPISKATKNNDSNRENLLFFDKWRGGNSMYYRPM
jgi:hypothetical protein